MHRASQKLNIFNLFRPVPSLMIRHPPADEIHPVPGVTLTEEDLPFYTGSNLQPLRHRIELVVRKAAEERDTSKHRPRIEL